MRRGPHQLREGGGGGVEFLCVERGCQMVHFQTKKSNFGILLKALKWNISVYFMTIWYFETIWCMNLHNVLLVYFMVILIYFMVILIYFVVILGIFLVIW
jgi:hypothetical protein